jgi:hypothetical protein
MANKFTKPNLVGGSKAPEGHAWQVISLSRHHANILHTLSRYRKQHTGHIIAAALCLYEDRYRAEISEAFTESKGST